MCIAFSIPKQYGQLQRAVSIPVVIETLEYRSDTEEVVVAFDCIVRNDSSVPIDLWITHVDNVEGRLGTEDWFSISDLNPDENAAIVRGLHDGGWIFDLEPGLLRYVDPASGSRVQDTIVAKALSFRPNSNYDDRVTQVHGDSLDMKSPFEVEGRNDSWPIYRLESFPRCLNLPSPNTDSLPFTTFKIGPIPPSKRNILTFFRVTVVITGSTYHRLVAPDANGTFVVYSADRVCEEISDFGLRRFGNDPKCAEFKEFFIDEISNSIVSPKKYQIIVRQPHLDDTRRKCVIVRPTSSRIGQRVISDPELRQRALWFNAWSTDFSLLLAYCNRNENSLQGFRVTESSSGRIRHVKQV